MPTVRTRPSTALRRVAHPTRVARLTRLTGLTAAALVSAVTASAAADPGSAIRYDSTEIGAATGIEPLFSNGIGPRGRVAVAVTSPDGTQPAVARPGPTGLVTELLPLPPDAVRGFSRGVSASGLIGGYVFDVDYDGNEGIRAVAWRLTDDAAGTPLPEPVVLPDLGNRWATVSGVTEDDVLYGYAKDAAGNWKPVVWRPNADGATWSLDPIPWDLPDWAFISDVSARGELAVGTIEVIPVGLPEIAATWAPRPMNGRPAGLTFLSGMPGAPEGTGYRASHVNASGVVAGIETSPEGVRTVVRWVDGVIERVDPALGFEVPFGLDEDGRILTIQRPDDTLAWIERDGTIRDIDPGFDAEFFVANLAADGRIVATRDFPGSPDGTTVYVLTRSTGGPDVDGDGVVGFSDLLQVLASWSMP